MDRPVDNQARIISRISIHRPSKPSRPLTPPRFALLKLLSASDICVLQWLLSGYVIVAGWYVIVAGWYVTMAGVSGYRPATVERLE